MVTHTGVGAWVSEFVATIAGRHVLVWAGAGNDAFADTQTINVTSRAGGIVSLADLKRSLSVSASETRYDDELSDLLATATAVVEHYVGDIVPKQFVEFCDGGNPQIRLKHTPIMSIELITEMLGPGSFRTLTAQPAIPSTTFTAFGYSIESPNSGIVTRRWSSYAGPFHPGSGNIQVQYTAGREIVPPSAAQACKDLARINWQPKLTGNRIQSGGIDQSQGEMFMGLWVPNRVLDNLVPAMTNFGIA